jgi:hypothetical protein
MARRDAPCAKDEFSVAYLISDGYEHVMIDSVEMTAENIWNRPDDRNELVEKLVDYFYATGFTPYAELSDDLVVRKLGEAEG